MKVNCLKYWLRVYLFEMFSGYCTQLETKGGEPQDAPHMEKSSARLLLKGRENNRRSCPILQKTIKIQ